MRTVPNKSETLGLRDEVWRLVLKDLDSRCFGLGLAMTAATAGLDMEAVVFEGAAAVVVEAGDSTASAVVAGGKRW